MFYIETLSDWLTSYAHDINHDVHKFQPSKKSKIMDEKGLERWNKWVKLGDNGSLRICMYTYRTRKSAQCRLCLYAETIL